MRTIASSALLSIGIWSCITPLCAKPNYGVNTHWDVLGDFVYMRRQRINNHSLVKDADKFQCPGQCPNFTVISNKDLVNRLGFEPGARVGVTYKPTPKISFEANALYIAPWTSSKKVKGDESLYVFSNQDFDFDFTNASEADAHYRSAFWDAELNFWSNFSPRRINQFSLSGIAGLRYFNWDEKFKLIMINPPDRSSYNIWTHNHILGLQLGLNFAWNPTRYLSWEATAKVGGMVDRASQKTFLGDFDNTEALRHFERHAWQVGIFTDLALQFAFYIKEHFNLHAGYQLLYFSGVALAPGQVEKSTKHDHKEVQTNGSPIIHGLFAGLTVSF